MIHELRRENAAKPMDARRAQALKGTVHWSILDAFQNKPNAVGMGFPAFTVGGS
jgi:hypothetical protein